MSLFKYVDLRLYLCSFSYLFKPRIKISVNTDISVIGFYGNIGNIGKISVDIFTKISVIKIFHILIIYIMRNDSYLN